MNQTTTRPEHCVQSSALQRAQNVRRIGTPADVDVLQLVKNAIDVYAREGEGIDDPGVLEDDDPPPPAACPRKTPASSSTPAAVLEPAPAAVLEAAPFPATNQTQSHSNGKRKRKREREKEERGCEVKPYALETYAAPARTVETDLDAETLPVTSCGYAAKNYRAPKGLLPAEIRALVEDGYELIENDGYSCQIITTSEGKIVAVVAGQPRDPTYLLDAHKVCDAMLAAGAKANFGPKHLHHKRGTFPAVNVGVTHSKGTKEPVYLNLGGQDKTINDLLDMPELHRMVRFANSSFRMWAPRLYAHCRSYVERLFKAMPHLRRIFRHSIFPSCAFNFGPRVCTISHRDQLNVPYSWCAVQALGRFDPKTGGHMVLDDVKKIIEFPAASLLLIPSAVFAHRNVGVAKHETRLSFTQYCAGGIFRYIDNGFQTEASLRATDPSGYAAILQAKKERWHLGLSLWSTLEEVLASLVPAAAA